MEQIKEVRTMTPKDIKEAEKLLVKCVPGVLENVVDKIIMYGSCARGDFNDDSDIDIAILTTCDRLEAKKYDDKLMDIVTEIAMKTQAIVEYICIPLTEYMEKKSWYGYFKNIENEGRVIYG